MTKAELSAEINRLKTQLRNEQNKLNELNKDFKSVEAFQRQIQKKVSSFYDNVQARRKRLSVVENFAAAVKAIGSYAQKTRDVLSGKDYNKIAGQIETMQRELVNKKNSLGRQISDTEYRIRQLRQKIANLQQRLNAELK